MHKQRVSLTVVWWVWGVALFALLILFSNQPAIFDDKMPAAWQWFLPNITPTLMLVGAVAYKQRAENSPTTSTHRFWFLVALAMSVFYLGLLTLAIVKVIFVTNPLESLAEANNWLAPVQGLAASALGVFFSGEAQEVTEPPAP